MYRSERRLEFLLNNVSERTAFRIFAKQRKEFLEFLRQKEAELSRKYPFENGLDIEVLQG